MMLFAEGLRFDYSISLGQVISAFFFLCAAIIGYRDLSWRVKNLEVWRREHQVDADSRDQLIRNSETMLTSLKFLVEDRKRGH
jgi:hypothetical protein